MIEILLIISAICLIVAGQISGYDQMVFDGSNYQYSSKIYKLIMTTAKYLSILPVFMFIYVIGYGEISWYFKLIIWAIAYLVIKIFGTWLFAIIFGFGRGSAKLSFFCSFWVYFYLSVY